MTAEVDPASCCGEKYCGGRDPKRAGQPLAPTCQLCPESPSYWRRGEGTAATQTATTASAPEPSGAPG